MTRAETGAPPDEPVGGVPLGTAGTLPPSHPVALQGGALPGAVAQTDPAGLQPAVLPVSGGTEVPVNEPERPGSQEGAGMMVTEPVRLQALATPIATAAPRGPDAEATALARSLLRELPLAAAREHTLTVSFPAPGSVVEQIVLSTSGGVVSLVVTARAQARERVAAALPELSRLLRARGLRIGSVGLD